MLRAWGVTLVLLAAAVVSGLATAARIAGSPAPVPENLIAISRRYYGTESRWKEIALANGITDYSQLAVGRPILIPDYVPPPPPGMEVPEDELRITSPMRDAFDWPALARALVAYLVSAAVVAGAVLLQSAGAPGAAPGDVARAALVMAAVSVSFASVAVLGVSVAGLWAGAISGSRLCGAVAGFGTVAGSLAAVLVMLRFAFPHSGQRAPELAAGIRYATMLTLTAAAGLGYLLGSGFLATAALYAAGG